jgi:hypothetical protein
MERKFNSGRGIAREGAGGSRVGGRDRDRSRPACVAQLSGLPARRAYACLARQGHRGAGTLPTLRPAADAACYHTIDARQSALMDLTLAELGIPPRDILGGRAGSDQRFYEFGGDRTLVLGGVAEDDDPGVSTLAPRS